MTLPKIQLSRKKLRAALILVIILAIPVTLVLVSTNQELRRRAAPSPVEVNPLESVPLPGKGRISGYKWNDQNGNGRWDTGEPAYAEGTIIILSGTTPREDSTDTQGYFEFNDLEPGDYIVEEIVPDGWRATTATSVAVSLAAGDDREVNFGNVSFSPARARISGHQFNDLNGDGGWDTAAEPGVGKGIITLKDSGGATIFSTETWEGTDLGFYLFEKLEPGNYVVEETVPEGFQSTTDSSFEVTLTAGDEKRVNFGVILPPSNSPANGRANP